MPGRAGEEAEASRVWRGPPSEEPLRGEWLGERHGVRCAPLGWLLNGSRAHGAIRADQRERLRRVFSEDAALWTAHCGGERGSGAAPGAAMPRRVVEVGYG